MNSLVAKCQENGWLRIGGYAWQDDPYLEEYPYSFSEASSLEEVRSFFEHGNWSIRQGIVYRDLAFVQQVDGGDEWWTLKKLHGEGNASDWVAFESCSFDELSQDEHGFNDEIVSMLASSGEECARLSYRLPSFDEPWSFTTANAENWAGRKVECKILESRHGYYNVKAYERPGFGGATLEISNADTRAILFVDDACPTVVAAAVKAHGLVEAMEKHAVETPAQLRSALSQARQGGLKEASQSALDAAGAINSQFNMSRKATPERF